MNAPAFTIANNIAIPARSVPNAGPRESKYPVDDLEEGQAFAVPVESTKQARQKQSQFSGLAKTRGIKLVTRFIEKDEDNPGFEGITAPFLAVWHAGPAPQKDDDANADTAEDTGGEASDTSTDDTEAFSL